MKMWPKSTLAQIIEADDLKVAPFREDGTTYGTPTWIWCVEVDGKLFVRPWNGLQSRWFRAAIGQKAGRIIAAGQTFDVTFSKADPSFDDSIDAAYRTKYEGKEYLPDMIGAGPREASVEITLLGSA